MQMSGFLSPGPQLAVGDPVAAEPVEQVELDKGVEADNAALLFVHLRFDSADWRANSGAERVRTECGAWASIRECWLVTWSHADGAEDPVLRAGLVSLGQMQKVARPIEHLGRLCRLKQDSLKLTIGDPRQTMARATVHNPVTRRDLIP